MKKIPTLEGIGLKTPEEGFSFLLSTLRPSLKLWDYFVNWEKVFRNTRAIEMQLNLWNYLLGKSDFEYEFLALLEQHPEIVQSIPALLVRDGSKSKAFSIIESLENLSTPDLVFNFDEPAVSDEARQKALYFVQNSGLERLFRKDGVKNLVDYVLGVEAGLDSNGRKNRSGISMEEVVGAYLRNFCNVNNLEVVQQADANTIFSNWGFTVPVDKASRRFDFAISDGKKLVLMEVNFYGGGGSKLKATAGEFKGLFELLSASKIDFVWVTDGEGWKTTERPLQEAFNKLDYLWNLRILNSGCLRDLFTQR